MARLLPPPRLSIALVLVAGLAAMPESRAWDYEGHRLINQLAIESLPKNFPSFVFTPAHRERLAFLAGEPDRWRNTTELPLKHCNGPDHYFDIDLLPLADLSPARLSPFRYEFVTQLTLARAAHPQNFRPIDPQKDADRTGALIGFLPWTITEYQGKLKSAFSYLKEYEAAGTPEEIANAQQNVLYVMGVLGHFVGDGSQPLHTTKHHHGWVGPNPHHYSTNYNIHSWIDGGYLNQLDVRPPALRRKLRPARLLSAGESTGPPGALFPQVISYLLEQHRQVEPLYQLEKAGKLSGPREPSEEGHDFITGQMLQAAQMLGDLWLTAWRHAPPDPYLRSALAARKLTNSKRAE
jgi:hypothetical protein